jgi:hypothetical protein
LAGLSWTAPHGAELQPELQPCAPSVIRHDGHVASGTGAGGLADSRVIRLTRHEAGRPVDTSRWPATVPAVEQLLCEGLELPPGLTVLVGENGDGSLVSCRCRCPRLGSTDLETPTARPLRWTKLLDWLADPRENLDHTYRRQAALLAKLPPGMARDRLEVLAGISRARLEARDVAAQPGPDPGACRERLDRQIGTLRRLRAQLEEPARENPAREDLAREAAARRGMINRLLSELAAQRDGYAD